MNLDHIPIWIQTKIFQEKMFKKRVGDLDPHVSALFSKAGSGSALE
jgi:hypothetical protein